MALFSNNIHNAAHGSGAVQGRLCSLDHLYPFNIVNINHTERCRKVGGRFHPVPVNKDHQAVFIKTAHIDVCGPNPVSAPRNTRFFFQNIGKRKGRTFLVIRRINNYHGDRKFFYLPVESETCNNYFSQRNRDGIICILAEGR